MMPGQPLLDQPATLRFFHVAGSGAGVRPVAPLKGLQTPTGDDTLGNMGRLCWIIRIL